MTGAEPVVAREELDRMTKAVGRAMVRVAGQGWTRLRAEYRSVGRHVEVDVLVTGPDGVARPVRPPTEVVDGLARLRAGMYRPGRGTWIGGVYEIEPPGTFTCEFDPDVEPTWRRVPPPIGFVDELRAFPRSEEFIPDWFRARAGMPPAVSPETQSAGTPPHGIPAQQPPAPAQQLPQPAPQLPPPTQQPPPPVPASPPPAPQWPTGQPGPQVPQPHQGGRHAAPPPPWENPPPSGGPGRHAAGPGRPPAGGPQWP
ncbi:hypothetical protein [Actinokineospora globicatena]|uniref:Uncharacterized protein n=1 Tax=Actinokineospora globicatena TaxID=103729 RepID=A0A9W6QMM6_9PSEU|nr:hypothetical protein [Actinokineospora globicatena]GLW91435.1 hypothetical protein Aglo03_22510 [Actinokineospora globicatena]